jgi:hypothetical protein
MIMSRNGLMELIFLVFSCIAAGSFGEIQFNEKSRERVVDAGLLSSFRFFCEKKKKGGERKKLLR